MYLRLDMSVFFAWSCCNPILSFLGQLLFQKSKGRLYHLFPL